MLSKLALGSLTAIFLSANGCEFDQPVFRADISPSFDGCAEGFRAVFTPAVHGCFPETAQARP